MQTGCLPVTALHHVPSVCSGPGVSIVLLGNTAVGKSASANTIIGRAAFESRASLKAVTTGIGEETGQRFGKLITVIDTPGLLGSEELIEKYYLGLPHSSTPVLSLVVVRVGRFTEEDRRAVETAIRVLGPRRFENSYLLFTGGDALKDKSLQDFVSEDEAGPLHQVVQRFAGRTHLFNNEGGGREQVRELLQKAGNLHSFLSAHSSSFKPCDNLHMLLHRACDSMLRSGELRQENLECPSFPQDPERSMYLSVKEVPKIHMSHDPRVSAWIS